MYDKCKWSPRCIFLFTPHVCRFFSYFPSFMPHVTVDCVKIVSLAIDKNIVDHPSLIARSLPTLLSSLFLHNAVPEFLFWVVLRGRNLALGFGMIHCVEYNFKWESVWTALRPFLYIIFCRSLSSLYLSHSSSCPPPLGRDNKKSQKGLEKN